MNLTSRIESYTVGGQILISEATKAECGDILRIDDQMEVMPKGVKEPITIYEVGGIGGGFQIYRPEKKPVELSELSQPLHIKFTILEGKHASDQQHDGTIVRMFEKIAEIATHVVADKLMNLKVSLFDSHGALITPDLYVKVIDVPSESPPVLRVNFTAVPPEAEIFFGSIKTV
jgi:adenylate cyclase